MRISAMDPANAEGTTKERLAGVNKMLGATPNVFRTAAQSAVALDGVVGMFGAVAKGKLTARTRAAIAMTVAEANGCDYCLSAHTYLGKAAGLADADLDRARDAFATDPTTNAILRFARTLVTARGRVTDDDLNALHRAGVNDEETLEVIANVVLNIFTNYINLVAQTEIDFPVTVRSR